ncbi:MAG: hypothetical protein ACQER9_03460 [Nanobdellota archaeon]
MDDKRGVFFLIDVVIALVIVVAGFLLLQSGYSGNLSSSQTQEYSEEVIYYLNYFSLDEFKHPFVNNIIKNSDFDENTGIDEVIANYCYEKNHSEYNNFISHTFEKLIPKNLDFRIDVKYYNLTECLSYTSSRIGGSKIISDAEIVSKSRGIVSSQHNYTEILGPYMVEVSIW